MKQELKDKLNTITEAEATLIIFSTWSKWDLIASALLDWEQYKACESLKEKWILQAGPMWMVKITSDLVTLRNHLRKNFTLEFSV